MNDRLTTGEIVVIAIVAVLLAVAMGLTLYGCPPPEQGSYDGGFNDCDESPQ